MAKLKSVSAGGGWKPWEMAGRGLDAFATLARTAIFHGNSMNPFLDQRQFVTSVPLGLAGKRSQPFGLKGAPKRLGDARAGEVGPSAVDTDGVDEVRALPTVLRDVAYPFSVPHLQQELQETCGIKCTYQKRAKPAVKIKNGGKNLKNLSHFGNPPNFDTCKP